ITQSPDDVRAMCICPTQKAEDYFQNDFAIYQEQLQVLFAVYTDKEIETLFTLMTRLYEGIENLEKRTEDEET
ncbi:MAG: MarR family transcriptional regulator, partial [Lachnospiraceae bacterium]|nr:MarR family transcriptional regulator [Lachnospiraceae bacterium]